MNFLERLMNIDRRVIYGILGLGAIIPFFMPMGLPINVTREVQSIYDFIEEIPEGKAVFLAIDYDPQTEAECTPQAKAILRHYFRNNLKVLLTSLSQNGAGMAELIVKQVAGEYGKVNGVDYVFLGYKPYPGIIIMEMGENIAKSFPEDYYNTKLSELPMMDRIKNYNDIELVVSVAASSVADMWVIYAHERYGANVALAVTAVSGPQYYTYVQSKQIVGLIPGLKGAAEYESLLADEYAKLGVLPKATQGMDVQSITHIIIILFIVIGNISYFVVERRRGTSL